MLPGVPTAPALLPTKVEDRRGPGSAGQLVCNRFTGPGRHPVRVRASADRWL